MMFRRVFQHRLALTWALLMVLLAAAIPQHASAQSGSAMPQDHIHMGVAAGSANMMPRTSQPPPDDQRVAAFAREVDLSHFGRLAVHTEGRVKSFDSFARSAMYYVTGSREIEGHSHGFTYFDMMLRPDAYADADVIFVKNKPMRATLARSLRSSLEQTPSMLPPEQRAQWDATVAEIDQRLEQFIKTGLISPSMLNDPAVQQTLDELSRNVLKTAKFVQAIYGAMNVMHPQSLRMDLKLVAPPGGGFHDRWLTIDELAAAPNAFPALSPQLREQIVSQWNVFTSAWAELNAPAVNDAAVQLAMLLPRVNPEIYPDQSRLAWESWYFRMYNMTWVWAFYALALIPLMLALVYRWPAARWIGMGMFLLAFGLHTFAVLLRWYVSQRFPNSNMFEAVTTSAWFGGCLALVFEPLIRRTPMRGLLALGSAAASMTALMAAYFLPLELNANISNMMPVLNDVWLYIHTNVIILSYCLIFMAAVTAGLYLLYRAVLAVRGKDGVNEFARAGGAASLILTRPDGSTYLSQARSTLGQVLDGTTMVVMEMSFVLLWAGLVMGAIWADHSWGRPWGWDPKEVFALNTFLVFLVLVHGRLKVKDKGLWTAALALIGAVVMLFNWIIINFAISGLHSYA